VCGVKPHSKYVRVGIVTLCVSKALTIAMCQIWWKGNSRLIV
jgi:hypothetical protein